MAFFLPLALLFFARICASLPICMYKVGNFTSNSTYKTNLDHVFSSIATTKDNENGFYNFSYGQSSDSVNAIGFCLGDTEPNVCRSCLNNSIYLITQLCPKQKEAIGWYDDCMLRYSSRPIFGAMEAAPYLTFGKGNGSVPQEDLFRQSLKTLLYSLKDNASSGGSLQKYAAGDIFREGLGRIYALLQCTPDLSQLQCDECFDLALKIIPPCCSVAWNYFSPSCNVRYQMSSFFEPSADSSPPRPLVFVPSSNTTSSEGMLFSLSRVLRIKRDLHTSYFNFTFF